MKLFAKLHVLQSKHGRICAAAVSKGTANDSPYLRMMISAMPPGCGVAAADAAYGGKKNCGAVRDSGRKPAIQPKKNYSILGSGARAEMLQFCEEHPRTFHNTLRDRNNVENGFSVMKERFGAMVRALTGRTQSIEMLSMVICFNMLARGPCRESGAEPRPSDYGEAAHDVPWTAIMTALRQLGPDPAPCPRVLPVHVPPVKAKKHAQFWSLGQDLHPEWITPL